MSFSYQRCLRATPHGQPSIMNLEADGSLLRVVAAHPQPQIQQFQHASGPLSKAESNDALFWPLRTTRCVNEKPLATVLAEAVTTFKPVVPTYLAIVCNTNGTETPAVRVAPYPSEVCHQVGNKEMMAKGCRHIRGCQNRQFSEADVLNCAKSRGQRRQKRFQTTYPVP